MRERDGCRAAISESLQRGEDKKVAELTRQALDAGLTAGQILNDGLLAGMDVVSARFGANEIFLPEVLLSARAMNAGMDLIKPLLIAGEVRSLGKVVIGTMRGDLHDIGKNLVGVMLKGAGFEVIDLGANVAPERFVDTAEAEGAQVVGLSALLTTTMTGMKDVVSLVKDKGLDGRVKVIVGGAPLSQAFADEIGADGYGYDASNAVTLVKRLTGSLERGCARLLRPVALLLHRRELLGDRPDLRRHVLLAGQHRPQALADAVVDEVGTDELGAPGPILERPALQLLEEALDTALRVPLELPEVGAVDVERVADVDVAADGNRPRRRLGDGGRDLPHQRGQRDDVLEPGLEEVPAPPVGVHVEGQPAVLILDQPPPDPLKARGVVGGRVELGVPGDGLGAPGTGPREPRDQGVHLATTSSSIR
jgi:5-methyltetrahydrofolate--homocysteine methyltransferase